MFAKTLVRFPSEEHRGAVVRMDLKHFGQRTKSLSDLPFAKPSEFGHANALQVDFALVQSGGAPEELVVLLLKRREQHTFTELGP
ncbi:MAG: hypothetical protein KF718_06350 [Polyangiaceae bacterium]|nr:hypothetical protein [Polyangiaceae bacterium]